MKPAFSPDSREQNLRRLREAPLDVLILGGGINGAGIARDFALRAKRKGVDLRIGLVEKRHFASGTSGKNSHLIHGGLRYLKYFEFSLVQEALHERAVLLRIAPHLVEPLPLLLPFYGWSQRFLYGSGLWMYDLLAGARNIGRHRILSSQEVEKLEPGLSAEGLVAGASFYDCRVNSSRLLLENVFDARRRDPGELRRSRAGAGWRRHDPRQAGRGELSSDREENHRRHRPLGARARPAPGARLPPGAAAPEPQ
jgi:glycerol-3-phosphate dehydrogenase